MKILVFCIIVLVAIIVSIILIVNKSNQPQPSHGPILDFLCKNSINNAVNAANSKCNSEKNLITSNLNNLEKRVSNIENDYIRKTGDTFTGDVEVPFLRAKRGILSEADVNTTNSGNVGLNNLTSRVSGIQNDYIRKTGDTFTGDVEVPFLIAKTGIRSYGPIGATAFRIN